jgi:N-acylneuraminate cytidylyltransferase
MDPSDNALAVIPARGGSRRIPGKNIRPLGGVPLIVHTIRAALDSGCFGAVVVSTDSEAIRAVAIDAGADVPFVRPAALADDFTPSSLATLDALDRLDPAGRRFKSVCQLLPSCPLRNAADLAASRDHFLSGAATAQISVTDFPWTNPWWAMKLGESGQVEPLFPDAFVKRSQDMPALVAPSGAIWWATAGRLRATKSFHGPDTAGCRIPWERALDIDTEADFRLAESLLAPRPDEP